jgi:hypothetical protein
MALIGRTDEKEVDGQGDRIGKIFAHRAICLLWADFKKLQK